MIVKILGSAGSGFRGVQYNDNKVEKGKGELMLMKNFPSFINENSSAKEVRDYLKSVSKNEKVKKPQFHTVISTKYQEHTKEELAHVAEDFMNEMGYGSQPFIVVFHNDCSRVFALLPLCKNCRLHEVLFLVLLHSEIYQYFRLPHSNSR